MSVWRWADRYSPLIPDEHCLSLGEGQTPCIRSRSIGADLGIRDLFFKLESANPSGSYKDRFAALAVSHMRANREHTCLATSSGNTGSALAAYCAAARIRCRIAVVESAPSAKLQQMLAHGAEIQRVREFGTNASVTGCVFERLEAKSRQRGFALQISAFRYSPLGMQGVESIAFELQEQVPGQTGNVFCPAGGGGLTLAVARGFVKANGLASVHCVQPEGNDTIASALRKGSDEARHVRCSTKISGLQVANVIDGNEVIAACRESGGTGHTVSDQQIFDAQKLLARAEGIFSEPAGAVSLAGALQAARRGELDPEVPVVCLITGSGFKDSSSIDAMNADTECPVVTADAMFAED
ncbi:threonine synthase [Rhodopirellula sp. SM50]|nr:pyridoxal-phosphate dependent enzyme [Rhodopirellula sp. SM50]PAY17582.1 threonine synthase [Rhodopirellula sp. SM50]